jgi:signal transduction histidine kinase
MRELAEFLRRDRESIIRAWTDEVKALPSAHRQDRATIRDHVPSLIEELAACVDEESGAAGQLDATAAKHGSHRFVAGYDVRDVVAEYGLLRRTILDRFGAQHDGFPPDVQARLRAIARLDRKLDEAIRDAVEQYFADHEHANDVLTGVLGHDLRAPLQSILMGAEMLGGSGGHPPDPAMVGRTVKRIRGAVDRMNRMINGLLDFTRARIGGGLPIQPQAIDLRTLIAEVVAEVRAAHPDRRIENHTEASQVDLRGTFGPVRLAQALTNLLVNAVQHGRDPIVVDADTDDDHVHLDVCNGGEIPQQVLPNLFKPFAGLSTRTPEARKHGGLGLGLYIVSEIARAHGGRIEYISRAGTTCFRIVLPRKR